MLHPSFNAFISQDALWNKKKYIFLIQQRIGNSDPGLMSQVFGQNLNVQFIGKKVWKIWTLTYVDMMEKAWDNADFPMLIFGAAFDMRK